MRCSHWPAWPCNRCRRRSRPRTGHPRSRSPARRRRFAARRCIRRRCRTSRSTHRSHIPPRPTRIVTCLDVSFGAAGLPARALGGAVLATRAIVAPIPRRKLLAPARNEDRAGEYRGEDTGQRTELCSLRSRQRHAPASFAMGKALPGQLEGSISFSRRSCRLAGDEVRCAVERHQLGVDSRLGEFYLESIAPENVVTSP